MKCIVYLNCFETCQAEVPEEPEAEETEFPDDPLFGTTFEIPEDAEEIELPKGMKYRGEWKVRQVQGGTHLSLELVMKIMRWYHLSR